MIKVYQLTMPQNNFIVTIPFKGCQVNAQFKAGNVAKGIFARLYTNDKFMQRALESSEMFGKIYKVVETVREPEDDEQNPAPEVSGQQSGQSKPEKKKDVKKTSKKSEDEPEAEPEAEADATTEQAANDKKAFDSVAEAILFIATNYGKEVKTKGEAIAFLAGQGITAVING